MSFTLCTSGAIVQKAGLNVNSTAAASGALLSAFCDQAEGLICAETRWDFVGNYTSVNTQVKLALQDCCSSLAAIKLINYDMSGYTSRTEAQTMLDVLKDNAQTTLSNLKIADSNKIRSL